jgi:Mg-chelatase subunit ChlD
MSSDALAPTSRPRSQNTSLAARIAAHKQAQGTFLLLDCSGSMGDRIAKGVRAIDRLRQIARQLRHEAPTLRQIVFPAPDSIDGAAEILSDIPEPHGTTPLDKAITEAATHGALHLIIVSDGDPNDSSATLNAADQARCRIDVFFVGAPGGGGEAFLRELARRHGGACDTVSLASPPRELETKIRGLLTA